MIIPNVPKYGDLIAEIKTLNPQQFERLVEAFGDTHGEPTLETREQVLTFIRKIKAKS